MNEAIGTTLPIAVAIGISPMPVIAFVVVLTGPRARTNGPAFLAGWLLGIFALGAGIALGASSAQSATSDPRLWVSLLRIILGAALVWLAWRKWRGTGDGPGEGEAPGWMATVDRAGPGRTFGIAVVLCTVNPKNLILLIAAGTAVANLVSGAGAQVLTVAVFTAVSSLLVFAIFGIYLFMGPRAESILDSVKSWMITHNTTIMVVILLVLGAKLIGDGLAGL